MANEDIWDGSWMLDDGGGQQEVTPPTPSPDMWDGSWMLDTPETPSQDPLPTTPSKPASLSWWDKFSTFDDPPPTQTSGQMFSAPLSQLADKISPVINVEKAKQTYIDPVLANFDRLNQGVVKGILGNRDTGGGILPGIWEGLTLGGERKSWGDIVGIDPSQRDQNVLERMARTGSRWALDNTLDPQNFLFGKMGGGKVPIATMAKKALGGDILKRNISESQLFKAFGHDLPEDIVLRGGIKSDDVNDLVRRSTYGNSPAEIEEAQRVARAEFKRLNDEVMARKSEDIADGLETGGVRTPTAEEIHQGFELRNKRPYSEEGKGLPENISDWGGAIPPELIPYMDAIQPLKDIRVANRERLIEQQKRMGHEESKMISEEDVVHAPQRLQTELGEKPSNITTSKDPLRKDPSREIVNWTDADGNVVQIGKFSDTRTGVETITGSDGSRFSINGVEVFPKQATLYDKMKAFPDLNWSTDILGNFTSATKSDLKKLGYLDLFEGLQGMGAIRDKSLQKAGAPLSTADMEGGKKIYRDINIPGFERPLEAQRSVANLLETRSPAGYQSDSLVDAATQLAHKINQSRFGQFLDKGTTWFKRTTLPLHPSFHVGNETSNMLMGYGQGMDAYNIPKNMSKSAMVQNPEVFPDAPGIMPLMTNDQIRKAMLSRDVKGTWAEQEAAVTPGYGGNTRRQAEKVPEDLLRGIPRAGANLVADFADKMGELQTKGFEFGGKMEANMKGAAFIDYISKHPEIGRLPLAEQEIMFDKAAKFAHDALIDYGKRTPFEKELPIPFYGWLRGSVGWFGHNALNNPQRLARVGRTLDAVFDPLPEMDKAVSQDYVKEGVPVQGAFGQSFGKDKQGNNMTAMIGRYLPHTNIGQMYNRPRAFALSQIGPLHSLLPRLAFGKTQQGRDIDPIAGSTLGAYLNPLIPGNKNWTPSTNRPLGIEGIPNAYVDLGSSFPGYRYLSEATSIGDAFAKESNPYKPQTGIGGTAVNYLTGGKTFPLATDMNLLHKTSEAKERQAKVEGEIARSTKAGDWKRVQHFIDLLIKDTSSLPGSLGLESYGGESNEGGGGTPDGYRVTY